MATKKEKRAKALAKREHFMEQVRLDGLRALQKDRARRERKEYDEWREIHDTKHVTHVKECPWCRDAQRNNRRYVEESANAS